MQCEPTRRSFMAAIGAAAAGAACPPITLARDEPGAPAYRTAGKLVEALAGKEVRSRELVDAAISRIERLCALERPLKVHAPSRTAGPSFLVLSESDVDGCG